MNPTPYLTKDAHNIRMPGMATAHSHAFQRALRGRTQRRQAQPGSFWSWRGLMYALAEQLTPEDVFAVSRFAFVELLMSGVTAVGEFHYVHHQPDGTPYADRTTMADAVIEAARQAGIRITLIRAAYFRGGYQQELEPAQRRFADPEVESVLKDVETLRQRYAEDARVRVGVAAHSIRAVPRQAVRELSDYARRQALPFHMHVSEQPREVEECQAEYGLRPVELLAEDGVLDERFVAVHATHLDAGEIQALGHSGATVCLCRTTERDLGDGLPHTAELIQAGARLCVGVDSHASGDAFEEIRAVELDERSRTLARTVAAEAPDLLTMATQNGCEAIGFGDAWKRDHVLLNAHDPSVAAIATEQLADAVVFAATPRAVQEVVVDGRSVVEAGWHADYETSRRAYETTLRRLRLMT